jgi:hypothetical protein
MEEGTHKHLMKMTKTKLVEEAHKYPEIVGAHGLSKEDLVAAISAAVKAAGEWVEDPHPGKPAKKVKKAKVDKGSLKEKIRKLRAEKAALLEKGDATALVRLRVKISRLKGKLRRFKAAL